MWRGWTSQTAADDYERFLVGELFPSMRRVEGFLRADVLGVLMAARSRL
jgi:hypothetical protein